MSTVLLALHCIREHNIKHNHPHKKTPPQKTKKRCGPCKLILPQLVDLQAELGESKVRIVKFNCNKDNKELGQSLNIRVAPTFHLYKRSEKVAEMTGAKVDKLRELIDAHM